MLFSDGKIVGDRVGRLPRPDLGTPNESRRL
jgi:hypothetical protein